MNMNLLLISSQSADLLANIILSLIVLSFVAYSLAWLITAARMTGMVFDEMIKHDKEQQKEKAKRKDVI